ncbi:hypothetical protein DYB32_005715 [Aphanomyces invadans]|uniref:Protein kinase domain-containing protein n=1 Tax=Aphanomyces invadans TaxID=157072 RepID=A0A3R6YXR0_9STRA|nr:hypothetical protein DYB32_005715 [Aphanomyces invadans]
MSRRTSSACDDDATTGAYKSDPVTPPRFVTTATSSAPYDATQFPLDARQGYAVLQRTELRHLKKSACGFFTAEYNNSVRVLVQKLEIAVMADAESTDNLATSVGSRMFVQRLPLLASLQHANVLPLLGAIKHSSTSMYAVFGPTSTQANASSHAVVSLSSLLYQDPKKPLAEDIAWATQKKWCLDIARAVEYLEDVQWEAVDRAWTSAQYIVLDDATRTCQVQCMSYLDVSGVPPVQSFGTNSLAWTAPEVVRQGESRRSAAHVFAMAVVFGEVVARVRPYASSWRAQGPVRADIAVMHLLTDTPTPLVPHEFDASVPAEFSTLVRRCLDRDPLKRPSPTDVIAALTQCR